MSNLSLNSLVYESKEHITQKAWTLSWMLHLGRTLGCLLQGGGHTDIWRADVQAVAEMASCPMSSFSLSIALGSCWDVLQRQ